MFSHRGHFHPWPILTDQSVVQQNQFMIPFYGSSCALLADLLLSMAKVGGGRHTGLQTPLGAPPASTWLQSRQMALCIFYCLCPRLWTSPGRGCVALIFAGAEPMPRGRSLIISLWMNNCGVLGQSPKVGFDPQIKLDFCIVGGCGAGSLADLHRYCLRVHSAVVCKVHVLSVTCCVLRLAVTPQLSPHQRLAGKEPCPDSGPLALIFPHNKTPRHTIL